MCCDLVSEYFDSIANLISTSHFNPLTYMYKVRAGKPQIGSSASVPAFSCEEIERQGESEGTGWYYLKRKRNVQLFLCGHGDDGNFQVSYGSGTDGNITISRSTFIEDIFEDYNPRAGIIPEWQNVELTAGATLSTRAYDPTRNGYEGGIIVFKATGTVTVCSNCNISATAKGYPGGKTPGRRAPRRTSERSDPGKGPGAGRGGCGGDCNNVVAHGSGGGGGSFATRGTVGIPDRRRQTRYNEYSATPGNIYNPDTLYFSLDPKMGSGGGAGGLGHRNAVPLGAPGSGGAGGGAIQIAAQRIINEGVIEANGERGHCATIPQDGNPQTGSGGSGSGGLITLVASNTHGLQRGTVSIKGGDYPQPCNRWARRQSSVLGNYLGDSSGLRAEFGQMGGKGGDGYFILSTFPDLAVGQKCSGTNCRLGGTSNPARSCQQLYDSGIRTDGQYRIGTPGRSSEWYCKLDVYPPAVPSGYSWGDGLDGDITIRGTKTMKEVFPGYNPKTGVLPQWRNVVLASNAVLTVDAYDGGDGGLLAFSCHNLRLESGSRIDVYAKGYRGGKDKFWRDGYGNNLF